MCVDIKSVFVKVGVGSARELRVTLVYIIYSYTHNVMDYNYVSLIWFWN